MIPKAYLPMNSGKRPEVKTVLIVGHSNIIPTLVNTLLKNKKYSTISESDYGIFYTIEIKGDTITDTEINLD